MVSRSARGRHGQDGLLKLQFRRFISLTTPEAEVSLLEEAKQSSCVDMFRTKAA